MLDSFLTGLLPAVQMTDIDATLLGYYVYQHGIVYNNSASPTITLSSGGGTLSSVDNSVFIPYQMKDRAWRLRGEFSVTLSSTSRTSIVLAVAGIDLAGGIPFSTGLSAGNPPVKGYTVVSGFEIDTIGAATAAIGWSVSFDVRLNSKPTWAY